MRKRRYFTQPEMEEVWDRWENGESLNSIARGLDRGHSAVQGMLSRTGGVRPAPRSRSRLALTLAEREEISRGIAAGHTMRAIVVIVIGDLSCQGTHLREAQLAVSKLLTDLRQPCQCFRHPQVLPGRAEAHAATKVQPVCTRLKPLFSPVLVLIELAHQFQQVTGGGIDIAAQLGDLVTQAISSRLLETGLVVNV